jgi:hypothetical protein
VSGDQTGRVPPVWSRATRRFSLPSAFTNVELVGCASDRLERGAGECDPRRPHLRGRVQPRRDRGGRSLGLRAASEHRDERDSDERDEGHDCRVLASATPRALPRFLDQRLDKSLELPRRDGIVWSAVGEAGR